MLTNSELTLYHKKTNSTTHNVEWVRYNFKNVWFFGGKGASVNRGYENANDVDVRIPYDANDVDVSNISIGDILVKGRVDKNINAQNELNETYNITSINDNNFGNTPHLHLGGK